MLKSACPFARLSPWRMRRLADTASALPSSNTIESR
jgi:hypothetical protein